MKIIDEIKSLWNRYGSEKNLTLYACDCGGYDTDEAVMLTMDDDEFVLKFQNGKEFTLVIKK